jgi:hypothetical protein
MHEQGVQVRFQLYVDVYAQTHFAGGCEGKRLIGQCQEIEKIGYKVFDIPHPNQIAHT